VNSLREWPGGVAEVTPRRVRHDGNREGSAFAVPQAVAVQRQIRTAAESTLCSNPYPESKISSRRAGLQNTDERNRTK